MLLQKFDLFFANARRAITADMLYRTMQLGKLPSQHHFILTFDTTSQWVTISDELRSAHQESLTIVLQNLFYDLIVEDDYFEVTLSFFNKLERIKIPFLSILYFCDPSVSFSLVFSKFDFGSNRDFVDLFSYARGALKELKPIGRIDYTASEDRVRRAVITWMMANLKNIFAPPSRSSVEIMIDNFYPGIEFHSKSEILSPEPLQIFDPSFAEFNILSNNIKFLNRKGSFSIPISAIRLVKFPNISDEIINLGDPAPEYLNPIPLTAVMRLHDNAERAKRAVMAFALQVTEVLRRPPSKHHFYITFSTRFPGVELAEDLVTRHPVEMTIVLQYSFWNLSCTDSAFQVVLAFGGVNSRLTIPYLAVTRFNDPEAEFDCIFPEVDPGNLDADKELLAHALRHVASRPRTNSLNYSRIVRLASRAAINIATSEANNVSNLPDSEDYIITFDPQKANPPLLPTAPGEMTELHVTKEKPILCHQNELIWCVNELEIAIPFSALRKFTAVSREGSFSLQFEENDTLQDDDPNHETTGTSSESLSVQLLNRFVANSGHLVHKLKAKDTTGGWAFYHILVLQSKERAFLDAISGDGIIDLNDYGKIIASCYGEEPSESIKDYLKNEYGFDV